MDSSTAHLVIKSLRFSERFPPFDFELHRSECVGLTGPSGVGKTLFLRAVADMDEHAGDIFLNGREQRWFQAPEWRRTVGLLPAESQWWLPLVGGHFVSAKPELLERLGFDDDVLAWSVDRLSTGEKQRLALVRILENCPSILLLDEPTASLDSANTKAVEEIVKEYLKDTGASCIWTSHDREQIGRICRRTIILRNNAIEIESWT